jgi:uncharacterized protein YnzC (UPF0291/DUF896 family)
VDGTPESWRGHRSAHCEHETPFTSTGYVVEPYTRAELKELGFLHSWACNKILDIVKINNLSKNEQKNDVLLKDELKLEISQRHLRKGYIESYQSSIINGVARHTVSILRGFMMSNSEAVQLFGALQELKRKLEILEIKDLVILNADDRDELYEIIVFMDDRFSSF